MALNQGLSSQVIAYKFNPSFLSDEQAVENFVVRKGELERIITAFLPDANIPRVLVFAPRGAGKTTLCRRLLAEVHRSPELRALWHPIFLGEECYSATTPGEFLLECVFHLRDRSPESSATSEYKQALLLLDEKELVDQTLKTLTSFAKRADKRLLIVAENFQIILADQIGSSAKELLALLKNDRLFGIL